jgi:hypothetical protein
LPRWQAARRGRRPWAARPVAVAQALKALGGEPLPPGGHALLVDPDPAGDLPVGHAVGGQQAPAPSRGNDRRAGGSKNPWAVARQAALVHRASPAGGRVLASAGRCRHRLWPYQAKGAVALVGRPSVSGRSASESRRTVPRWRPRTRCGT